MGPANIFAALHRAVEDASRAMLFTVTILDRNRRLARRVYSSNPTDYPVTGIKPVSANAWTAQVIDRGEVFVANSTAEFAPYFADHALINALGCEAALNIPISADGKVVGTVNVLGARDIFTEDRVAALNQVVADYRAALVTAFDKVSMENRV
ncbi:GAF domain-containing protein [Cognatiyoonia sp. IB215446]|uniref:GAF domain-containing protein n=1 Tax=Cognatiyoonia sp. IB215446 TaxID=3097355 RepID=UPI002A121E6F|nr:GAF domain-containing protein [Cognatiyoonia sp. IB215446]MDX8348115.1 GAF domain-containing protein [Cognatiyoonia sp. IB215446]